MIPDLSRVNAWVFDLDHTLYPPSARLFARIEVRINAWITRHLGVSGAEADQMRADYWARYGTTLAGLMAEHGADPRAYLDDVHDVDLGSLTPDPGLRAAIAGLPGRRIVFTNGDVRYAARVLAARGLTGLFDALYGVEEAGHIPKPDVRAFNTIFARDGLNPASAAMFDDDPRNLAVPARLGMVTVLVGPGDAAPHIHHQTKDLTAFLRTATAGRAGLAAQAR